MNSKTVAGLIILFLMVSSIFGFVFSYGGGGGANTLQYGDFTFRPVQNQLMVKIDGTDHRFVFFPADLEYIEVPEQAKSLLTAPVITVTYNPSANLSENLADAQYYFELQLEDAVIVERALTDSEGTSLPQKSCADATSSQPVIDLREANESNIIVENNCIVLNARDSYGLYQQSERLIYQMLGVMS